jgi:hypothetical protein
MGLPKEISELVERFERNREAYRSGQYNEMQLRQEFLDPDHEKTAFQRQIEATDQQIDKLVYELYGLTEEEIKIVEERLYQKRRETRRST